MVLQTARPSTATVAYVLPARLKGASMQGWDGGPYYPPGIEQLQAVFDEVKGWRSWIDEAARQVDGFKLREILQSPRTLQGNDWSVGYVFSPDESSAEIGVFFPVRADGRSEHHCAIFSNRVVQENLALYVRALTANFGSAIED